MNLWTKCNSYRIFRSLLRLIAILATNFKYSGCKLFRKRVLRLRFDDQKTTKLKPCNFGLCVEMFPGIWRKEKYEAGTIEHSEPRLLIGPIRDEIIQRTVSRRRSQDVFRMSRDVCAVWANWSDRRDGTMILFALNYSWLIYTASHFRVHSGWATTCLSLGTSFSNSKAHKIKTERY